MRHHLKVFTLTLSLLILGISMCEGAWILEGQVWNSPYTDTQVYFSQLSIELAPHEHVQTFVSLPIQYTSGQETGDLTLQYPRLALAWSVPGMMWSPAPSGWNTSSSHSKYNCRRRPNALRSHRPNCALSWQKQTFALEGSLVFAVNERWALGPISIMQNALLRYGSITRPKAANSGKLVTAIPSMAPCNVWV